MQKQGNPTEPVSRSLFGTVDAEVHANFVKEQNELVAKEMRDKYNFDFVTETPLEGRYQWEKVPTDDQENVPLVYDRMPEFSKLTMSSESGRNRKRQTHITGWCMNVYFSTVCMCALSNHFLSI